MMSILTNLAARLRSDELPLMTYLDQLEVHFNQREPTVLAFVPEDGRFQRLRQEAEALLAHHPDPDDRPPLFGIPIGVKDIFHVDGFVTRAGSQLPPAILQGEEAASVTRLRQAGALILGKTVTTEFAYFAPGPTRNPHSATHTPGGSSSGSAAAVGAGLCPLALGTQTIGSINRPAAFCGIVGYKPGYDRISKAGVIPLSPSLDHVGVLTRTVADAALAASLLCDEWLPADVSEKPVLAVPEGPYLTHASDEGLAHFRTDCTRLMMAGFAVYPILAMADFAHIYERHNALMAAEAAQVHAGWFAQHGDLYHQKTADLITRGQSVTGDEIAHALNGRSQLRTQLTQLMDMHGIDLWVSPAAPGAAPETLKSTGDPVMNLPWTHSGLPTLTIPSGFSETGLPLGLQVTGRWQQDEAMLTWAEQIEDALQVKA